MFLIKTIIVAAALAAGLLTSPPAAATPSRIPERAATLTTVVKKTAVEARARTVATEFFRSQNEPRYEATCRLFSRGFYRAHRLRDQQTCFAVLHASFIWSGQIEFQIGAARRQDDRVIVAAMPTALPAASCSSPRTTSSRSSPSKGAKPCLIPSSALPPRKTHAWASAGDPSELEACSPSSPASPSNARECAGERVRACRAWPRTRECAGEGVRVCVRRGAASPPLLGGTWSVRGQAGPQTATALKPPKVPK